ncbi:MAG: CDGSH iron-sulfur domain-containing protein [Gemmataceae bacterium]|jgi:CDGSH-type Zn-finger protein|nr:CDGSH iron-sulfur domain-containing protein [Planctomycetota bacterium]
MSDPVIVRCRDNGPFVLPASVQVVDADGKPFAIAAGKEVIALCRCGASKNKPFCDGAHKGMGFAACEKAPAPAAS